MVAHISVYPKLFGCCRQKLADRLYRLQSHDAYGGRRAKHHHVGDVSIEEVILVCKLNRWEATNVFMRRPIFRMSHGLTNIDVALPPSTADAEG